MSPAGAGVAGRRAGVAGCAGAAAVALALVAGSATAAGVTLPKDFTIPKAESSPGGVTFSHARHMARIGRCSACHMRDVKMKRGASGPMTMAALEQGRLCGACHDGKASAGGSVVFSLDQCDACHKD